MTIIDKIKSSLDDERKDSDNPSVETACGTTFGGKVHVVSAQAKERIKGLAEDYFVNGALPYSLPLIYPEVDCRA